MASYLKKKKKRDHDITGEMGKRKFVQELFAYICAGELSDASGLLVPTALCLHKFSSSPLIACILAIIPPLDGRGAYSTHQDTHTPTPRSVTCTCSCTPLLNNHLSFPVLLLHLRSTHPVRTTAQRVRRCSTLVHSTMTVKGFFVGRTVRGGSVNAPLTETFTRVVLDLRL